MFFKLLPTLTKTKLDQAKVVFKSDHQQAAMRIAPDQNDNKEEPPYDVDAPFLNTQDTYACTQELSDDTQPYDLPDRCVEIRVQDDTEQNKEDIAVEVMHYLQQLQEHGIDNENVKVIYVQNGQIVGITDENSEQDIDSNLDENKEQENQCVGENNEQQGTEDSNCTQYENVILEKVISRKDNVVDRPNVLKELMTDGKSVLNMERSEEVDRRSNISRQELHKTKSKR